jgi:hypothetical protein
MRTNWFRPFGALAAGAALLLTACSPETTSSPLADGNPDVSAAVLAGNPYVIVSDNAAAAGTFTSYLANNSIRTTTEFWDNTSADFGGVEKCNIGFYAAGQIDPSCINDVGPAAGSDAGSVAGVYTQYLADGVPARDATAFMFAGSSTYDVTLKGAYHGQNSEVGWYTKTGTPSVYTFHSVPAWGTSTLGTTVAINTLGQAWGLYIKNGFNPATGGCAAQTSCSDAEGGFTSSPFQQFALFANATGTTYLIGAEDNALELLPNGAQRDSDYNDYIWSVVPTRICDFITFGRLVTEVGGNKVVISGNAGGNAPGGGILGEFHIDINGTDYHVSDIDTYGPISSGALSSRPNSRVVTGIAKNGASVELRLWDGGEPGKNTDEVYVKINGVEYLGAAGHTIDQGNMQYHPECRGPK